MEGCEDMEYQGKSYHEYVFLQNLINKYLGIPYIDLTATHYILL